MWWFGANTLRVASFAKFLNIVEHIIMAICANNPIKYCLLLVTVDISIQLKRRKARKMEKKNLYRCF